MKFYKMNHQEKGALKMVYHERKLMSTKFLTWMDHNLKSLKEKRNYQSCPLICLLATTPFSSSHGVYFLIVSPPLSIRYGAFMECKCHYKLWNK